MSSNLEPDDDNVAAVDRVRVKCMAQTAKGTRCTRNALLGHLHCKVHGFHVPTRPSALTPAVRETIILAVLEGAYLDTAAALAGVSVRTLHRWQERGDNAEARAHEHMTDDVSGDTIWDHVDPADWPYLEFRHALKAAEAFAEVELLRMVKLPTHAAWQAYMTILERRWPQRWRRRDTRSLEVTGQTQATVQVVAPSDEDRAKVLRAMQEAGVLDEDPGERD